MKNTRTKRKQKMSREVARRLQPTLSTTLDVDRCVSDREIFHSLRKISTIALPWSESSERDYGALLGGSGSVSEALSSNTLCLADVASTVSRRLKSFLEETPASDICIKRERIFELATPIERCVVDLRDLRKKQTKLKSTCPNNISLVRFSLMPDVDGDGSALVVPEVVTLCWGQGLRENVDELNRIGQKRSASKFEGLSAVEMLWLDTTSELKVDRAIRKMFSRKDPHAKIAKSLAANAKAVRWTDKTSAGKRAVLRVQLQTLLPLRKMLKSAGGGKPILQGAIADMIHALGSRCEAVSGPIHRDGVQRFWSMEFRRLGWAEFDPPLIKFH